jgi:hypothetical protein
MCSEIQEALGCTICVLLLRRLLALLPGHIKLYGVEDLSMAPQLQARFALPVIGKIHFKSPSAFYSAAICARLATPYDFGSGQPIPQIES